MRSLATAHAYKDDPDVGHLGSVYEGLRRGLRHTGFYVYDIVGLYLRITKDVPSVQFQEESPSSRPPIHTENSSSKFSVILSMYCPTKRSVSGVLRSASWLPLARHCDQALDHVKEVL